MPALDPPLFTGPGPTGRRGMEDVGPVADDKGWGRTGAAFPEGTADAA